MKIEFGDDATHTLLEILSTMRMWVMDVTYRGPEKGGIQARVHENLIYRAYDRDEQGIPIFEFGRVSDTDVPTGEVIHIEMNDIENIYVY